MAKMPAKVMEKLNDPKTFKFMATVDKNGTPNVVYIGSLRAYDEETIIYGDSSGVKTKANIQETGRVAINVYVPDKYISYQIKGTFLGFEKSGKFYEMLSESVEFKYNPHFGARAVGVIKVAEVYTACAPLPGRRIVPPEPYTIDQPE
jgi:predicted pyridoxine 5'-phosphate oxidase superfamily flavin-nucleotide-binding protein